MSTKAGLAILVVYPALTLYSWALYPNYFCPCDNWLSDLGNYEFNPDGAIAYNVGCILSGLLGIIFIVGLRDWRLEDGLRAVVMKASRLVGVLAAASLVMIGFFSEDYPPYHGIFSVAFFCMFGVFILLFVPSVFTHPKFMKPVGIFGLVSLAIDIGFGVASTTPILEWISVFGFLVFTGLLSFNMASIHNTLQDRGTMSPNE